MRLLILILITVTLNISNLGCSSLTATADEFTAGSEVKFLNEVDSFVASNDQAIIEGIENIGSKLHQYVSYEEQAYRMLLKQLITSNYADDIIVLTHDATGDYTVSFYRSSLMGITLIADILIDGEKMTLLSEPKRSVSNLEISLLQVKNTAMKYARNRCSKRFKLVIFESADNAVWEIYSLAMTTDDDLILVGGHQQLIVDKDDLSLVDQTAFSKSCLVLDKTPTTIPKGSQVDYMIMTHLVDRFPAPTHVFLNLRHTQPFVVGTDSAIWRITEGKIELIRWRDQ